jgi:serine/threonine-protein phosphatase 5
MSETPASPTPSTTSISDGSGETMDIDESLPPFQPLVETTSAGSEDPEREEKSAKLKQEGNEFLSAGKYLDAIRLYSEALEYTPTNAIVLSNRAQAFIKVENYGLAICDADAAILSDSSYVKAYYRRASANFALNKFKAARKDFRQVCKLRPKDRDARLKLNECEKRVKEEAFAAAITADHSIPLSATYDANAIMIDTGYEGPHPLPDGLTNDLEVEAALFSPGKLPMEFVMVRNI